MRINKDDMIGKLQACLPYTEEPFPFKSLDLIDPKRSEEIRRYFECNAGLNLDKITSSQLSTWEKVLIISRIVFDHIPHDIIVVL